MHKHVCIYMCKYKDAGVFVCTLQMITSQRARYVHIRICVRIYVYVYTCVDIRVYACVFARCSW